MNDILLRLKEGTQKMLEDMRKINQGLEEEIVVKEDKEVAEVVKEDKEVAEVVKEDKEVAEVVKEDKEVKTTTGIEVELPTLDDINIKVPSIELDLNDFGLDNPIKEELGKRDKLIQNIDNIPYELRDNKNWVVYREGSKIPQISSTVVENAKSNDPTTWRSFQETVKVVMQDKSITGIGYALGDSKEYTVIDIDYHPGGREGAELDQYEKEFKEVEYLLTNQESKFYMDTYTEKSMGGKGYHIVAKYKVEQDLKNTSYKYNQLELYYDKKIISFTGDIVGGKKEVKGSTVRINHFLEEYFLKKENEGFEGEILPTTTEERLTDLEVVETALRTDRKFKQLWEGNWEEVELDNGYGYGSRHVADYALILKINYYTGNNPEQTERVYKSSPSYKQYNNGIQGSSTVWNMVKYERDIKSAIKSATEKCVETIHNKKKREDKEVDKDTIINNTEKQLEVIQDTRELKINKIYINTIKELKERDTMVTTNTERVSKDLLDSVINVYNKTLLKGDEGTVENKHRQVEELKKYVDQYKLMHDIDKVRDYPKDIDRYPRTLEGMTLTIQDFYNDSILFDSYQKRYRKWNGKYYELVQEDYTTGLFLDVLNIYKHGLLYKTFKSFQKMDLTEIEVKKGDEVEITTVFEQQVTKLLKEWEEITNEKTTILTIRRAKELAEIYKTKVTFTPKNLRDGKYINLQNGVLDKDTKELFNHHPKYKMTEILNASYNVDAKAPFLTKSIERQFDLVTQAEFKKFIGSMLAPQGSHATKKLGIIKGKKDTGKTGLVNQFLHIMNGYGGTASEKVMVNSSTTGGANPEMMDIIGKAFLVTSEFSNNQVLNGEIVKQLTGNTQIKVRNMRQSEMTSFTNSALILIDTNALPNRDMADKALMDRILVFPYENTIPEGEIENNIDLVFEEEADGVLNFILEGYDLLKQSDFVIIETAQMKEAKDEEDEVLSDVKAFINETLIITDDNKHFIKRDLLHEMFLNYQQTNKNKYKPKKGRFYEELEIHLQEVKRSGVRGFKCVGINEYGKLLLEANTLDKVTFEKKKLNIMKQLSKPQIDEKVDYKNEVEIPTLVKYLSSKEIDLDNNSILEYNNIESYFKYTQHQIADGILPVQFNDYQRILQVVEEAYKNIKGTKALRTAERGSIYAGILGWLQAKKITLDKENTEVDTYDYVVVNTNLISLPTRRDLVDVGQTTQVLM